MSADLTKAMNSLNDKLFEMAGIEHRVSSAYHPQTNGLDERMNQTMTKSIVKYHNPEQDDWDDVYMRQQNLHHFT